MPWSDNVRFVALSPAVFLVSAIAAIAVAGPSTAAMSPLPPSGDSLSSSASSSASAARTRPATSVVVVTTASTPGYSSSRSQSLQLPSPAPLPRAAAWAPRLLAPRPSSSPSAELVEHYDVIAAVPRESILRRASSFFVRAPSDLEPLRGLEPSWWAEQVEAREAPKASPARRRGKWKRWFHMRW